MGYIPDDAKWYLAGIVNGIIVEGDPRIVVHTNLVLVRADSPDEAYEKSMRFGKECETTFQNPADKRVDIVFRGLHSLKVIYDQLEDGAELDFHETVGMNVEDLRKWIIPKEKLSVFMPVRTSRGPDYASADVIREVSERFHVHRPTRSDPKEPDNES